MLKKIQGSLAYRLPAIYRQLLRFKNIKPIASKKGSDITILSMTGKHFINMTRLSLESIAKTWSSIPNLIITSDETISIEQIKKNLAFWPGELKVESWEETATYHRKKNRMALLQYGDAHPFGKKLAIILRHAETGPVIWIDSDILFFNDFTPFIPQPVTGFACGGTEDFTAAYHEAVVKKFNCNLYELYQFNAGLLYVSGQNIYEDFKLEDVLETIHPEYDFCTEQTIFAYIASKSIGILWPATCIKNFNTDNQQVSPMPVDNDTIARHYTSNIRHLFWRDAFLNL